MIRIDNFHLINEFFENAIIFKPDYSVMSKGSLIYKLLAENEINIEDLKTGASNKNTSELKEAILKVFYTKQPGFIEFLDLKEKFILFPITADNNINVVLGLVNKTEEITRIERDLKERVKELQCLYSISKELDAAKTIQEAIEKCTLIIQKAFFNPEETIVQIEYNDQVFGNLNTASAEIPDILKRDIKINENKCGEIRIYLNHNSGFLTEEYSLINEIANKFSLAIEKNEKERNHEKQQKILKAKNDALLRMTDECNKSRQRLRTFFQAITETIVVVDTDFNIIMSNKEEIGDSGKCFEKIFNKNEKCNDCPAVSTFASSEISYVEVEESEKFIALRTYPIFGKDKNVNSVLEVCRDVTTQKKMESQLLQSYKLASLGKLVAGVAHEINNPNTFILGNLKIVQESISDLMIISDKYYEDHPGLKIARLNYDLFKDNIPILLNDMIEGANRTKKIVSDLRNFAKKDDGGLTDLVDINNIIKNNISLTRKNISKFALQEMDLCNNIPCFKGNESKLEQVLINLIMNASEAIEHAEGLIKIKTDYAEKEDEVVLTISDNGCGMDETTIKNIFDPFFTTKRDKGGTGLGLSITYGIIKEHGGKIDVESKAGEGTIFTIRFPVKKIK
jgi:signal transduction histidine kinase